MGVALVEAPAEPATAGIQAELASYVFLTLPEVAARLDEVVKELVHYEQRARRLTEVLALRVVEA